MTPWARAAHAAALFARDPSLGLWLRAGHGPARDAFLVQLRALFAPATPWRKAPLGVSDEGLLGGLDVAATLSLGRPVVRAGLLAEADGGVLTLAMAERISAAAAGRIAAAMDNGAVTLARDGFERQWPARFGVLALDEGIEDEAPPSALTDRLALVVDLGGLSLRDIETTDFDAVEGSGGLIPEADERALATLTTLAARCGIVSLRAPSFALRAARGLADLAGRPHVADDDLALAAALTLAPRALTAPDAAPPPPPPQDQEEQATPREIDPQEEIVLAAVLAALPQGLLERLGEALGGRKGTAGKSGAARVSRRRGRPTEPRAGSLSDGRLALLATLRAAAPWRKLRGGAGLRVTTDDIRIRRYVEKRGTVAVFVVDASGSQAARRLGEVKGAVERLLADCYVRRDSVALVAFRGKSAEIVLAPTRSLARARRTLAGLPGGGGTPLASGLALGLELSQRIERKGETALIVLLTDGRGNVARDGTADRAMAADEARSAARAIRLAGVKALAIDSAAPARRGDVQELAQAMGARYVPLPFADSGAINRAVRAAAQA